MTTYLLIPLIILVSATLLVFVVRKAFNIFLQSRSSFLKVDPTNYSFLSHSLSFLIYFIAIGIIIYSIPELKGVGESLFAVTGIAAAVLAFASQAALSNIISGVFIVIFRPFRVEDIVEVEGNGHTGIVEDITLRHTVIKDFENKRIIIPNSIISNQTIVNKNIADERLIKHFEIGISFDSDLDLAMEILEEEVISNSRFLDVRTPAEIELGESPVRVRLVKIDSYQAVIRAWVWVRNPEDYYMITWDLLKSVKKRFEETGIEIPFQHRTIVYKYKKAYGDADEKGPLE